MYSCLSRLSSSLVHRLSRCESDLIASRSFSVSRMPPGHLNNFREGFDSSGNVDRKPVYQGSFNSSENVARKPNFQEGSKSSENVASNPIFEQGFNSSENVARNSTFRQGFNSSDNAPRNSFFRPGFNSSENVSRNSRSMNFVRGVIDEDGKDDFVGSQFPRYSLEQNADIVHMKLMKNNTFVSVTDSKGNKKLGASAGSLPEMKGGPKLSKYAAEATAEHVGRMARNFGLKSVVMKVKGFTYFKKKRQAIVSWKEGFTNSKVGMNPVVYIEDTTRKPHNGCRLPKQRRV